jgi:hypothetical protein
MIRHPKEVNDYDWESLVEGQTERLVCGHYRCQGKLAALTITKTWDGAIYNCYRCGTKGKVWNVNTPGQAKKRLARMRGEHRKDVTQDYMGFALPHDFVNLAMNIKTNAYAFERSYLYKYEIDDNDIVEYNIGYSQKCVAIIYPIYEEVNGKYELLGYQERHKYGNFTGYSDGFNKYKMVFNRYIVNKYYNNKIYYNIKKINNNKIILVEDILSAIKVHKATGQDVIALLNTSVTADLIPLVSGYDKAYLWLDYDQRTKVMKKVLYLQGWGIDAKAIVTEQDPKAIPLNRINSIIER